MTARCNPLAQENRPQQSGPSVTPHYHGGKALPGVPDAAVSASEDRPALHDVRPVHHVDPVSIDDGRPDSSVSKYGQFRRSGRRLRCRSKPDALGEQPIGDTRGRGLSVSFQVRRHATPTWRLGAVQGPITLAHR